jgi:N-acetylneuraminic acid mutarotase
MPSKTQSQTPITLLLTLSLILLTFPIPLAYATEDSWTTKASMPTAAVCKAALLNGKIYVVGGSNNYTHNPVYEYNPATDTWATKKPVPTPRDSFAIAACQNKIYVIGGTSGWSSSGNTIKTGLNEVYDLATDTWETKTSMPTKRYHLEANAVEGKIYVIGGRTGGMYTTVALNEVYDPETDTWTTKEPIPYPVVSYASAVVDNKIYIIGGQDEFHDSMNLNCTQIYDSKTDTWSQGAQTPVAIWQATAGATTGTMAPKRIYVMGGEGGFVTPLNQTYVYDPETDVWSAGISIPTPLINPAVAVVNDLVYVIGGTVGWLESTAAVEQYTPVGYVPEFPSWIILPLLITSTLVIIICKRRLPKTSRNGCDGCKPRMTVSEACRRLALIEGQNENKWKREITFPQKGR